MLVALDGAGRQRLVDDDLVGVEALAQHHAWPFGQVDVVGRDEV